MPQTKVRDNACNHFSRWPVGCRRPPQQQRALGMEHLDGGAQRRPHAASRAPTPASGARRCSTRARAAIRGRATDTACTAARCAPSPPFPRRPRRLARCTASARAVMRRASRHASSSTGGLRGGRRARSVSERAGKGGHSHTYQEHAHCACARVLDAVGRARSCGMRLEGMLRVPNLSSAARAAGLTSDIGSAGEPPAPPAQAVYPSPRCSTRHPEVGPRS